MRDEALAAYRKALAIAESWSRADPDEARWQRRPLGRPGQGRRRARRRRRAWSARGLSAEPRYSRAARRRNPANLQWQHDLALAWSDSANLSIEDEQHRRGPCACSRRSTIRETLAEAARANGNGSASWRSATNGSACLLRRARQNATTERSPAKGARRPRPARRHRSAQRGLADRPRRRCSSCSAQSGDDPPARRSRRALEIVRQLEAEGKLTPDLKASSSGVQRYGEL